MTSPDINTLNGALEQLGITMAENLVTMGVSDADPSDGLTTLAQKILQVSPTPASWDGMSLERTAGKQILSYADYSAQSNTEYCTVTAQLLDGASSATISGVPVVFGAYQNDVLITGSEQSVNTDSNGQASYTYVTAGVGDIVVKAVPDERSLLIQTYAVYDYYAYQTSGSHTFSSSTMTYYQLYDLNSIGDCEISVTLKSTNTKGFSLEYRKNNNDTQNVSSVRVGIGGDNYLVASSNSASGTSDTHYPGSSYSSNSNLFCKIVRQNNSLSATIGSTTYSLTYVDDLRYIGIMNWNNAKTVSWTDFKVKKL